MKHRNFILTALAVSLGALAILFWKPSNDLPPTVLASAETPTAQPKAEPTIESLPLSPPATMPKAATASPDAVKNFREWAKDYLVATHAQREALLVRGADLAKAHTHAIAAMIRRDPQQAIANAVPMVVRQDLPPAIVALLEQRVNMKAALEVCGNVPLPDAQENPQFEPYTRTVTTAEGGYWHAFVYGARAAQRSLTKTSINGISVGSDMAVADSPVRQLETGERPMVSGREVVEVCPVSGIAAPVERTAEGQLPAITEESPAFETAERIVYVCSGGHISQLVEKISAEEERQHWESQGLYLNAGAGSGAGTAPLGTIPGDWTTGQRKFLYIRAAFPDQLVDPQNEAECLDSLRQMADFIAKSSYGRCYFTYAVAPLVVLPYPESWYIARQASPGGGDYLIQNHARTLARAMGFDYQGYDLDAVRWNGSVGRYGGMASVGGRGMWLKTNSVTTFCHELGHNLGVWHANFWRTTPPSFIGPGNNLEYGNPFDLMGNSSLSGQFTAHFKNILNWLPSETHWNVTSSGLYRIHQFDYAIQDPSQRSALRITKDAEREYWAELRQRFTTNTGFTNGLMITWDGWGQGGIGGSGGAPINGSNRGAQLLDMTPGSFGNGITDTRNDSALWVGRTFSDPDANIHITPVAKNTGTTPPSMDVYVSVGAVPGNLAPSLAISANNMSAALNTDITLTATASDPNGDTLAYSWVFDDGTYSTNNSSMQTKSWSVAGHYQVLCTASDMKGGRTTRSILITVGSPSTFTVSGTVTGPSGQPLEGVYVANYAPSNNTSHTNSATFRGTWTDSDGNYSLTRLAVGSYTMTPTLYPNVFSTSGFANPLAVGPSTTGKSFTSALLPTITITAIDTVASEGTSVGTGTIRIERTGSTVNALDVQIFNANTGTATRNTDYTLSPAPTAATNDGGSGTSLYKIPAGVSFLDITVTPTNDTVIEGVEYAALNFANTSGGYVLAGSAVAIVSITDEESPNLPVVKLTYLDNTSSESGLDPATLKIERTGSTASNLTVNFTLAGTATSVTDYALPISFTIPADSASTTVTLTPVDDYLQEGTETAIVTIATNAAYARDTLANSVTVNIIDNDLPTVTVTATDATANETAGDTGTFTITRTGPILSQPLTVDYSLAGRAVHGVDYRRLDGRAVIPAGTTSTTVVIEPIDDSVDEGTQDVILLLRSTTTYASGGTGTATVNITDNDSSQLYLKVTASGALEPETGTATAITFQIIRPAADSALTVNYAISGTATSGVDFTALPGSVAFAAADTSKTITVTALADAEFEDAESVTLTLQPGVGYSLMTSQPPSATGYILDANQPTVDVSVADASSALTTHGKETSGSTVMSFVVTRKTATASPLTVNFTMSGTATKDSDYTIPASSVTIPANATSAYLFITPVVDTVAEGVETIIMNATPALGTYSIRTASATMLLGDNNTFASGSVGFFAGTSSVTESAGTHNVPVTITGVPPGTVKVRYRVNGGTAAGSGYDFTLAEGELEFPLGTTSRNIPITIQQDILPEPSETIVLRLFNVVGANLGTSAHTVTIDNLSMPEAFTDAPSSISATGATLNGRAIANGVATNTWFQYGPTTSYGSTTTVAAIGSGTASVNITAPISGFAPSGYHFRSVAQNAMGTTYGINQIVPSNNANLSALAITDGILTPVFASGTTSYAAVVANTVRSITLTPAAADPAASITVKAIPVPTGVSSPTLALSIGSNVINIVVTPPDGLTTRTYTVTLTRRTVYEDWAAAGSLTGPNSASNEDFDFDGIGNFIEFAFNTDPKIPSPGVFPTLAVVVKPADNLNYPELTYRRRSAPGTLTYVIQSSPNLATWTSVPALDLEQVGSPVPLGDGITEVVTFRILPSIETSPGARFFRLQITE